MNFAVKVRIRGRVQGVGYRAWLVREACRLGVVGWVRNRRDGSVEALLAGDEAAVRDLVRACRRGPPAARVEAVETAAAEGAGLDGFVELPTV
jgi:acylphosphatase